MGRSLRCIPEVVPNIVRAIQGGRLPLHPTAPVQPLLRRQPGLCNDEMLLKRVIRQLPFLCFVRYIYPRNKASPPNLAVSGLLSYLNYVSERPSCLCCEANITSQLSAVLSVFFPSSIPNLFRGTFKIALDLKFFTFYFPGDPGSGWC